MDSAGDFLKILVSALKETSESILKLSSAVDRMEKRIASLERSQDRVHDDLQKRLAIEEDRDQRRKENLKFIEKIAASPMGSLALKVLILLLLGSDVFLRIFPIPGVTDDRTTPEHSLPLETLP